MKRAILLVAFGVGSAQGQSALMHFDCLVRQRYPGIPVRWAFSSHLLRERMTLARKKSDSVFKAVRRLALERFAQVAVQPLQTIPGQEHAAVTAEVENAAAQDGIVCRIGAPLLATDDDVRDAARALVRHLPAVRLLFSWGTERGTKPCPAMRIWRIPCAPMTAMCMWEPCAAP